MKLTQKHEIEKAKKVIDGIDPHPHLIYGVAMNTEMTEGGVIKPESAKDKTPRVRVMAIGEQVKEEFGKFINEGADCYLNPSFMQFAEVDAVTFIVFHADAVIGVKKLKLTE